MKQTSLIMILLVIITTFSYSQNSVMDFYRADTKSLNQSDKVILKKDIRNGFISYKSKFSMGYKEMGFFISNNGKKFVAIATFACGPGCKTESLRFYELKQGKLVDKTATYYPVALQEQVRKAYGNHHQKGPWIVVPRYGTSIKIGYRVGTDPTNLKAKFIGELAFNVANGTFRFVRK